MSKKRKEPSGSQSSTILHFFGKGAIGSKARDAKKLKSDGGQAHRRSVPLLKRELPEDIIVIEDSDDSDDDDAVEVSSIRPAPRPVQNASNRNCGSRDASEENTKGVQTAKPAPRDPSAPASP